MSEGITVERILCTGLLIIIAVLVFTAGSATIALTGLGIAGLQAKIMGKCVLIVIAGCFVLVMLTYGFSWEWHVTIAGGVTLVVAAFLHYYFSAMPAVTLVG